MAINQPPSQTNTRLRLPKLALETFVALLVTLFAAALLVLTAINAGPLWRDEINTASVAQMPTLQELWHYLTCESFPPLYPLLLRLAGLLGLAGSDIDIRLLGLYVGLGVLGSFWLCARWLGCRAPILSMGLLGALPAFVFIMGSNRAYGLASCLLLLTFGTIWRMVMVPSKARILTAGIVSLGFAHCLYYDIVFLAAMLAGGALVALRRRQWKTLAALTGIGAVSAFSLAVYLPIVRQATVYVHMFQWPGFSFSILWHNMGDAVTARSSGDMGRNGPEIWLWITLLLGAAIATLFAQRKSPTTSETAATPGTAHAQRGDLAMFCLVSMAMGVAGQLAFLYHLQYWTQTWHYAGMLCLCAICFDGILGASWPALRPWGFLRIGLMVALVAWTARAGWREAHTRRSNMDLIATLLEKNASAQDLIVVDTVWEGITFNRYYHGVAPWATVPPVNSHLVHRNDLVIEQINQSEPMAPVLHDMTNALAGGHTVWLLGGITKMSPDDPQTSLPPRWVGTHALHWAAQVSATLLNHAQTERVIEMPIAASIFCLEKRPLVEFTGYRPGNEPTKARAADH